jgi:hypothetical protein
MPANKRIRKSPARTTKALVAETTAAPLRASDLKKAVHRLEVEIASAGRIASEHRHRGTSALSSPARAKGYGVQQRLTHAQTRKRRARWLMQTAMFLTSTCLVAGAGAWLFRLWQEMH